MMRRTPVVVEAVQCDLASALLPRLQHSVTWLLFNPPYVPTPDDEVGRGTGIEAAWAGGVDGRRVIDRFLPQMAQLLERPATTTIGGGAPPTTSTANLRGGVPCDGRRQPTGRTGGSTERGMGTAHATALSTKDQE